MEVLLGVEDSLRAGLFGGKGCREPTTGEALAARALVALAGTASWLPGYALFAQAALLVTPAEDGPKPGGLPEGSALLSYANVLVQAANVVPVLWVVTPARWRPEPASAAVFFLVLALASTLVLAALLPCAARLPEDATACDGWVVGAVAGRRASVGIMAYAFVAGTVGAMQALLIIPYLSRFRPQCTIAFNAGIGLCGVLVALLAFVQVARASVTSPNFSVAAFFYCISGLAALSLSGLVATVALERRHTAEAKEATVEEMEPIVEESREEQEGRRPFWLGERALCVQQLVGGAANYGVLWPVMLKASTGEAAKEWRHLPAACSIVGMAVMPAGFALPGVFSVRWLPASTAVYVICLTLLFVEAMGGQVGLLHADAAAVFVAVAAFSVANPFCISSLFVHAQSFGERVAENAAIAVQVGAVAGAGLAWAFIH